MLAYAEFKASVGSNRFSLLTNDRNGATLLNLPSYAAEVFQDAAKPSLLRQSQMSWRFLSPSEPLSCTTIATMLTQKPCI